MTFVAPLPNQTYHPRVYAAFGSTIDDDPGTWVWTDITRYVRPGLGPVTLSGGRPALTGTADPSQITLVLDNTDGRFTARSPLLRNGQPNPYWPNVVKNTPLKVAITWDRAVAECELLTAFVNGWPLQPNAGLINVSVPITATGRLRRMRKTNKLTRSALYRAITIDNNITYDGYWPMEDADGSSRFVSVPQATPIRDIPMAGVKRATLASNTNTVGSAPLADFSSGIRATATPAKVNSGNASWIVDHVLFVGDTPSGSGLVTFTRVFLPRCSYRIGLDLTNKQWRMDMFDLNGQTLDTQVASWASTMSPFDGQSHMIRFRQTSNIAASFDVLVDNVIVLSFVETILFGGDVRQVGIAGVATSFPLVIGHLLVVNNALPAVENTDAMNGFPGEGASVRVQRLCNEENIPVTILPSRGANQTSMGPQLIDTVSNLLDEVADVDDGLLHDAGTDGNLVYAPRGMRYNASVAMKLDYNRHQIGDGLASTYDDQDLITSNTISRVGGSSATVTSATSELYAVQDTVNCELDAQLANIAGWRTHLGTYDAYRLPTIDINLRTTPELAEAATTVELPFRLSPVNIPSPYPSESLDQFAEAFVTTIDSVTWATTYSCVPYGPWQVGVYADPASSPVTPSMLVGASYFSDTQWGVETTAGPWEVARVYSSGNFAANWSSDVAAHSALAGLAICISWKPNATELAAIGAGSRDATITAYLRTIPVNIPVFVEIWHENDVKNHQGTLPTTIAVMNAAKQRFYALVKAVQADDHPLLYTCLILSQFRLQAGDNENTWWVGGDGPSRIIDVVGFDTYLLNNTLGTGASFQSASVAFCESHGAGYAMPEIGLNGATDMSIGATWMANQADYAAANGPTVNGGVCCFLTWFDSTTGGGTATPSSDPALITASATISATYDTNPATWVLGGHSGASVAGSIYDSASSTLLNPVGLSDTSLLVTESIPGDVWTTNPAAFPFNIKVGASEIMRVTNIAPVVSDTFARSISNGWGTADTGQAWTTVGGVASDYSVVSVGSDGKHLCSTVAITRTTIIPVAAANMDVFVTFTLSAIPSGAPAEAALACRWIDSSNFYVAIATVDTAGATTILISKRVAGTDTNLTVDTPTGLVFNTAKTFALRVQAFGTLLRARVWDTAGSEPKAWQVAVMDGSLTAAGSAGCRSIVLTGSTMTSPTFFYDSFTVSYPQMFTVVRGVGGVQMTHAANEQVHIQPQAVYAL